MPGAPGRTEILAPIGEALTDPPVGLVLIEVAIDPIEIGSAPDDRLLMQSVEDRIGRETGPRDAIIAAGSRRLTIVKPGLTAPAEAEGFALRIHAALRAAMLVGEGRVRCQAAIGVAVSRADDTPALLVRFAEHALVDARMLGGDTVVAFDDQDRDLIIR